MARSTTGGPYLLELRLLRDEVPSFSAHPFRIPAIRNLGVLAFHPKVTFLVGENGSGKSTLLESLSIACGLNPEGGSRNTQFATRESHSDLEEYLRLTKGTNAPKDCYFLRAESFYNVATEIEKLGMGAHYGPQPLHEQSHGESFFALFEQRFRGNGLYLMDEPEAALSPNRQLQFLALMHDYCRRGAQFVIATHSPIIMAYPDAHIYLLDGEGIRPTPYEETEHYRVTRAFLDNPRRMLDILTG